MAITTITNGKGIQAGHSTAAKIDRSIQRGHRPIPYWEAHRWSTPFDLVNAIDLHEASYAVLDRLSEEVLAEGRTLAKLSMVHGDPNTLSEEIYGPRFDALEKAQEKIAGIQMERIRLLKEHREHTTASIVLGRF